MDGWVSLEVSPLLAHDTERTIEQVRSLHRQAGRPNLFIKIPGTPEGLPAIEESIFAGVPVNVTLLFSREQYLAAAAAYRAGDRAPDRGRDESRGRLGGIDIRQPVGQGGAGPGARRSSAAV